MASLLEKWLLSALLVVSSLICLSNTHRICSHVPPKAHEIVHHVYIEPAHLVRKRSLDQPLRVFLHFHHSVYNLTEDKFDLITRKVLPEAVNYWEKTLKVRHTVSPIRLNRRCVSEEVFFRANNPTPYCQDACEIQTTCGEVVVPEEHLEQCRVCDKFGDNCRVTGGQPGKGIVSADFVFYISAVQTDRCGKGTVVAYAAHCQQEAALDRPIAGHANLCPDSISTKPQELETLVSTVKHEMLHALGFSVSLYGFFRDQAGNPRTPRGQNGKPLIDANTKLHEWSSKVIRTIKRPGWKVRGGNITRSFQIMITPRVVEEARRHFGCDSLEGAELENQGGEGTALTHWEKRIFENEAMTGIHTQNPIYSRVTLALLEDSGWYLPNYNMSEELSWGRSLGCDFAKKSCKEWIDKKELRNEPIGPFCKTVKKYPPQTECMAHRRAVALCNLVNFTNKVDEMYQNFDSLPGVPDDKIGFYGGSVDLADYCPYLQEFTWKFGIVVVRGSQCQYQDNNPKPNLNFALESYGPNSLCFDHGPKMWEEKSCSETRFYQHWGSGCYQFVCAVGRLHIQVLDYTYTCYQPKQLIQIELFSDGWLRKGVIVCPPCQEICGDFSMKCLPDEKPANRAMFYHQDRLTCSGSRTLPPLLAMFFVLSLTLS